MAATLSRRIEQVEKELQFRIWVRNQRFLKSLSVEDLVQWAGTGEIPDRPDPIPGTSPLDHMTRDELFKLWQQDEKVFFGRNREELEFYVVHRHWPEQGCANPNCPITRLDGANS